MYFKKVNFMVQELYFSEALMRCESCYLICDDDGGAGPPQVICF